MSDPIAIGSWIFRGFGALIVAIGIAVTFEDPAGIFAIAFGLLFFGAGVLVKRLFATPPGMKEVVVAGHQASIRTVHGHRGTRSQEYRVRVDAAASEEEVEAARRAALRGMVARRPDWVQGRVEEEGARSGRFLPVAVAVWTVLALVMWGVRLATHDGFFTFAAWGMTAAAGGLAIAWIRRRMHDAKFGTSTFVLARAPAVLGERLRGTVLTGVGLLPLPNEDFRVHLACVHVWEETVSTGKDRRTRWRREVLWETRCDVPGQPNTQTARLSVPIDLEVPGDLPAASPNPDGEGIRWELGVQVRLPGLDYGARFALPIFEAPVDWWPSAEEAP